MEKKLDFKERLEKLDEILNKLGAEDLSIDESLNLYEEGKELVKSLEESLQEAEEKVSKVIETK